MRHFELISDDPKTGWLIYWAGITTKLEPGKRQLPSSGRHGQLLSDRQKYAGKVQNCRETWMFSFGIFLGFLWVLIGLRFLLAPFSNQT